MLFYGYSIDGSFFSFVLGVPYFHSSDFVCRVANKTTAVDFLKHSQIKMWTKFLQKEQTNYILIIQVFLRLIWWFRKLIHSLKCIIILLRNEKTAEPHALRSKNILRSRNVQLNCPNLHTAPDMMIYRSWKVHNSNSKWKTVQVWMLR